MTAFFRVLVLVAIVLAPSGVALAQDGDPAPDGTQASPDFGLPVPDSALSPPTMDLADPKTLEPALQKALEIPGGFCKSSDYELTSDERELCGLADAAKVRCPGFVKACERSFEMAGGGPRRSSTGREGRRLDRQRGGGDGSGSGRSSSDSGWEVSTGPLGELLGGLMQVIFWGLLVVGVGAMVFSAIKALIARRQGSKGGDESAPGATIAPVPRLALTGSPEELLDRARKLAATGELKGAMALLLRALLRHLEIGGRVELHPSRTNGDYVRSLRQRGHDPRELRHVAREVEAIEFGGGRASPEGFSTLHERVSKLIQVTGIVILCLGLGATGCRKRPASESPVGSCGWDAAGYAVLCEALETRGLKVHRRFTSVEHVPDDVGLVVVLSDDLDEDERKVLVQWVERGGKLVLFDGARRYDQRFSPKASCKKDLALVASVWSVPPDAKNTFRLPSARAFTETSAGLVRVSCDEPFALELKRGAGSIVAVADWRFATNASLAIDQNAALAASLVGRPGQSVELIGAWTGTGTDLPAQSLSRSGLLPWFLQILLFGFVFALYKGSPFGSRREPVTVTRRAFAEHALALGDAYSRAKASRIALVNFGSWALERLRVRLTATKHGRLSDLAGAVAARHSVSEAEVMSLVVAIRSAEDPEHDSATEAEHLAALRRLSALVKKTGGS